MLQFFKKSGQRDKSRSLHSSPAKSTDLGKSGSNAFINSAGAYVQGGLPFTLEEDEDDGPCNSRTKAEILSFHSRLSKSLPEILADKGALGYFIQFMETRGCLALIKFWLEVECLRSACEVSVGVDNKCLHGIRNHVGQYSSLVSLADDNDNSSFTIELGNTENHDNDFLSWKTNVNSNNVKSNCNNMPKTSQSIKKSNNTFEDKRHQVSTTLQDALRIYKKYITKNTLGLQNISDELQMEMKEALACENSELVLKCLSDAQKVAYKMLEDEHINDFLRSDFHCKHQIDVLTSGNVQLTDILYNETAFFYFIEFMELENKRELLDFWMSAVNYKQNLMEKGEAGDPMEAQTDALIIYDKYFSLQATMPLGFSDKIRFEVEQNICREGGQGPQPDCFDRPCKIVYNFLNKHYLSAFLSSQLYYKYLSELISTIQSSSCPGLHPRIRRAGSDCSSEVSTVSVNTQNAHQVARERNKSSSNDSTVNGNMNIDTRQLYDPDSLWRRHKYSLSVGYVDCMGRFVTEIEPDPHRKYESRLSRAVKRLVHMEPDKAKEELAWKIAEMIVREITTLTLGASELSS
ncbi:A-kinase anchor protein 10, mitochondrial [Orussus abietinus]|uniref:A-kinase anchor protein 10, mitochondrial n=1 Tax=Orussus abietinus TaxID=222816 RepID=UPI000625D3B5|nr:A-kinase anchor protein 10, mitochondrial [Orussus abietinus]XP_012277814.1 A-kinase anchor protein 10, mitochondrial [Orussus abietinus]XP_012277815.1 A-kinase anchor protein 10, mitochondrial [Orussus abietinus]